MRYLGYHAAAWRHPAADPDAASKLSHYVHIARVAEAAKLDMVFLADGVGLRTQDVPSGALSQSHQTTELEPLSLLSALAAVTSHIGLVATASTTYNEPYHIARKWASLDHLSGGRAGWNIVTSWSEAEALNFNRDKHMEYNLRYERATEFVEVVKGLWDSWDADALVQDKTSGVFFDPAKVHALNHQGQHFKVRGPLTIKRTPQGRPVLVQAGAAAQGMEIAASSADVVYAAPHSLEAAQSYYAALKGRLAKYGRTEDSLKIMPGLTLFIGRTRAEAQAQYDMLGELLEPELGLSYLVNHFGDLSGYPVDGPLPADIKPSGKTMSDSLLALARRENMTIRQLYSMVSAGFGGRVLVGTAQDIADDMQQWVEAGAADGFNLCPPVLPLGLEETAELLVPELQRRGMFRTEYAGPTLRHQLGLTPPRSRYAADR